MIDKDLIVGELSLWIISFYTEMEIWINDNRSGKLLNPKYTQENEENRYLYSLPNFGETWEKMRSEIIKNYNLML